MALKATIYKAQLQIADMDRSVYADHNVIIARHPSEADERMMIRLLAFALNMPADDKKGKLEFAKDLWDVDEAALWHKDYTEAAAMAKLFASQVAMDTTIEAVQIHGGKV